MTFSPIRHFDRQKYIEHASVDEACDFVKYKYDLWQPKYDGIWARVELRGDHARVYSRTGDLKADFHIKQSSLFSTECTILAEYMYGSQWAQHPDRLGKLFAFDLTMYDGIDLRNNSYGERYRILRNLLAQNKEPSLRLVETYRMAHLGSWWMDNCRSRAFEGIVLRRWSDTYAGVVGKVKLEIEDDFVIMGFEPGKGKHEGRLGALVLGQYKDGVLTRIMTCGGGFSDIERQEIWNYQASYLGAVCKIRGKARFASGALRHPNFAHVRHDKEPSSCVMTNTPSSLETDELEMNTPSMSTPQTSGLT